MCNENKEKAVKMYNEKVNGAKLNMLRDWANQVVTDVSVSSDNENNYFEMVAMVGIISKVLDKNLTKIEEAEIANSVLIEVASIQNLRQRSKSPATVDVINLVQNYTFRKY